MEFGIKTEGDFFELEPTTWDDVTNTKNGQSTLFFVGSLLEKVLSLNTIEVITPMGL